MPHPVYNVRNIHNEADLQAAIRRQVNAVTESIFDNMSRLSVISQQPTLTPAEESSRQREITDLNREIADARIELEQIGSEMTRQYRAAVANGTAGTQTIVSNTTPASTVAGAVASGQSGVNIPESAQERRMREDQQAANQQAGSEGLIRIVDPTTGRVHYERSVPAIAIPSGSSISEITTIDIGPEGITSDTILVSEVLPPPPPLPSLAEVNRKIPTIKYLPKPPAPEGNPALDSAARAARTAANTAAAGVEKTQRAATAAEAAASRARRALQVARNRIAPLEAAAARAEQAVANADRANNLVGTLGLGGITAAGTAATAPLRAAADAAHAAVTRANAAVDTAQRAAQPLITASETATRINNDAQSMATDLDTRARQAEDLAGAARNLPSLSLPPLIVPPAAPTVKTPTVPGIPSLSFPGMNHPAQFAFTSALTKFTNATVDAKTAPIQAQVTGLSVTTINPAPTAVPNPAIGIAKIAKGKLEGKVKALAAVALMKAMMAIVSKLSGGGSPDPSELGDTPLDLSVADVNETAFADGTPDPYTPPPIISTASGSAVSSSIASGSAASTPATPPVMRISQARFDAIVGYYNQKMPAIKILARTLIATARKDGYSPPIEKLWPDGSSSTPTNPPPADGVVRVPIASWNSMIASYNKGGLFKGVAKTIITKFKADQLSPPLGKNWPA